MSKPLPPPWKICSQMPTCGNDWLSRPGESSSSDSRSKPILAGLERCSWTPFASRKSKMFLTRNQTRALMSQSPKIGYVLKRFPRLSETFVLNEMLELERLGTPIQIYCLLDPTLEEPGALRHQLLLELKSPVIYLPARRPLKKWRVKLGHFNQ